MPKIKVAFIAHNPPYQGGIVQYSILLANAIGERVDLNVIGFKELYPRFIYKGEIPRFSRSGIDFKAPMTRILKWWSPLSWLKAYEIAGKADIIHINWVTAFLGAPYWAILMLNRFGAKRKIVITCHNITDHEPVPLAGFFTGRVFRMANQLIVHAKENKERLHKDFDIPLENITIVPHGDFSFFTDLRRSGENEIKRIKKTEDEKLILFFGYIRKYKGLRFLLQAFPEILKECPETRLVIAGECWEDIKEYEKLIEELKIGERVTLKPGFVRDSDVWKYFDVADLVVLPYHNTEQTISGPLLVSMAFGKAAVVGNCGGIGNLVRDGLDALLVPGGDVSALANASVRLIKDQSLREMLGSNAKAEIEKYNWADVADEIVNVYGKCG